MKSVAYILLLCCSLATVGATSIEEKPLSEIVAEADYVVIGKVTKVVMRDAKGREIKDPEARTGPGLQNELRLSVRIDRAGVLKTGKKTIPDEIVIPLWKMWHMDLAGAKEAEGNSYIFLLKADPLEEIYPLGSRLFLTERMEVERLIKGEKKKPNQSPEPTAQSGRGSS